MSKKLVILLGALLAGSCYNHLLGQHVAVKSNVLYDATATVNAGIEVGLAPHWSLDLSGNYNGWSKNDDTKWKHWMAQPEARYWLCDRFSRHFFGVHLTIGAFNFGGLRNDLSILGTDLALLTASRYQGYAYGGGVGYGYAFMLHEHWNLELEGAIGYLFLDYEKFDCAGCGRRTGEGHHHYFGPTKAAISIVYLF